MPQPIKAILSVAALVLILVGLGFVISRIMPDGRVLAFTWRELVAVILVSIAIVWSRQWRRRLRP
jgi:uncharacterized membrane protein